MNIREISNKRLANLYHDTYAAYATIHNIRHDHIEENVRFEFNELYYIAEKEHSKVYAEIKIRCIRTEFVVRSFIDHYSNH